MTPSHPVMKKFKVRRGAQSSAHLLALPLIKPRTKELHKSTKERCKAYNVPLLTSVDVVPLMKTAGVVKNSGHCIYSIGLKCF